MNLKMLNALSEKRSSFKHVANEENNARAIQTLNKKENKQYLQAAFQLGEDEAFHFDPSNRLQFRPALEDPDAPEDLRKALHYLFYHSTKVSVSNGTERSNATFSFD